MTQRTINLYDGLEALYYFDPAYFDTGANELSDLSGYERHATASGGPTIGVEGPDAFEATSFDGSDDYFDVGDPLAATEQTVALLCSDQKSTSTESMLGTSGPNTNRGYIMFSNNGDFNWLITNADTGDMEGPTWTPPDNRWRMMVGTWDGSTVRLYADGSPVGGEVSITNNTQATDNLKIGDDGSGNYYPHDIAMVGRWSRALTWGEIQHLNRMTAPRRALA